MRPTSKYPRDQYEEIEIERDGKDGELFFTKIQVKYLNLITSWNQGNEDDDEITFF